MNDTGVVVARRRQSVGVAERYHPWRVLRSRPHLVFRRGDLPAGLGAVLAERGGRKVIVVDRSLSRQGRSVALTHELVHDEWGLPCGGVIESAGLRTLLVREEAAVDREVARRLVPPDELAEFVRRRTDSDLPTEPHDVADEFDTTWQLAELSMLLMKGDR